MVRKTKNSGWAHALGRAVGAVARTTLRSSTSALTGALKTVRKSREAPLGAGDWIAGVAMGPAGMRRYRLYKPPDVATTERLPLLVMLHGCGQDANTFARSTRMNRVAARERFLVLYPEQDRSANPQGCWNWFSTKTGQAYGEASLIMAAIDQVCLLYPVDPARVGLAGLSAGASMAALLATRHPERFRAIAMHSGVAPGAADSTLSALGAMQGLHEPSVPFTPHAAPWPPLLVVHGGSDRVVAASNGQSAALLWAEAAGASAGASRPLQRGKRHPAVVTDYRVRGRTAATYCEIGRLGHAWSGGDAREAHSDAEGPDASRLVWSFMARQLRRTAGKRASRAKAAA